MIKKLIQKLFGKTETPIQLTDIEIEIITKLTKDILDNKYNWSVNNNNEYKEYNHWQTIRGVNKFFRITIDCFKFNHVLITDGDSEIIIRLDEIHKKELKDALLTWKNRDLDVIAKKKELDRKNLIDTVMSI
jgi:hypothetical protein